MASIRETRIIQGGMGVGVSSWRLARAVAQAGQLGVVSGTALGLVLARRLQLGDAGGEVRRALSCFPLREVADRILERYFIPGGKPTDAPFRSVPMPSLALRPALRSVPALALRLRPAFRDLVIVGNFVEVFLAREEHERPVGINYLEKIQVPTAAAIFGAMLAGVGVVIMGAGIPRAIPGVLDRLAAGHAVRLPVAVAGAGPDEYATHFDPTELFGPSPPLLRRPLFLPVVSSATLATVLTRKATGRIDGLVVEAPSAGGHNAPPRGAERLSDEGEPIYGPRDAPDLEAFRRLGLPFWLAGGQGTPDALADALAAGATGIQVGTAFAYCAESGFPTDLKRRVLADVRAGTARVRTDPRASPTGFPFKVLDVPGTLSDRRIPARRVRSCDLGYLRHAYVAPDGRIGWRCPAEPEANYIRKGGAPADTVGRVCVCNGLSATVGLGQVREDGEQEAALVTCGDDLAAITRFAGPHADSYSARDVIDGILAGHRG